jgi:hypothetical protein
MIRTVMAMPITPAELFRKSGTVEEFREKLLSLNGDFPLEAEDMMDLGNEYFTRYPDSFSDRNLGNVHAGYQIARACLSEKLLDGIDPSHRPAVRSLFDDIARLDETLDRLRAHVGQEVLKRYYDTVAGNLEEARKRIDELPRGMVKERFIGGITKFYNVLYLFKGGIERLGSKG